MPFLLAAAPALIPLNIINGKLAAVWWSGTTKDLSNGCQTETDTQMALEVRRRSWATLCLMNVR